MRILVSKISDISSQRLQMLLDRVSKRSFKFATLYCKHGQDKYLAKFLVAKMKATIVPALGRNLYVVGEVRIEIQEIEHYV